MFPRPPRLLRLVIFLSIAVCIVVSFVVITTEMGSNAVSNFHSRQTLAGSGKSDIRAHTALGAPEQTDYGNHGSLSSKRGSSFPDGFVGKPESVEDVEDSVSSVVFREKVLAMLEKARAVSLSDNPDTGKKKEGEARPSIVNPHSFKYIHNPSTVCERASPTFLIYIHSSPSNLKKRQAVRQTWGNPKLMTLYNATLVFLLGRTHPDAQLLVDMEAEQYGDIVQEDFMDSYRNLTHKGVASLKWVDAHCRQARYLLKTDDDILLDIVSLMEHLFMRVLPSHGGSKLVLCNLWTRMKVLRDTKSKWYISKDEFPEEFFPPYCSGSAFLLSGDLVRPLYDTALRTKFFWVDDFYVTGMLVNKLNVKHVRFNPAYLMDYTVVEEKLRNDTKELIVFHVRKLSRFTALWPKLVRRHRGMAEYMRDDYGVSRMAKKMREVAAAKVYTNETAAGSSRAAGGAATAAETVVGVREARTTGPQVVLEHRGTRTNSVTHEHPTETFPATEESGQAGLKTSRGKRREMGSLGEGRDNNNNNNNIRRTPG